MFDTCLSLSLPLHECLYDLVGLGGLVLDLGYIRQKKPELAICCFDAFVCFAALLPVVLGLRPQESHRVFEFGPVTGDSLPDVLGAFVNRSQLFREPPEREEFRIDFAYVTPVAGLLFNEIEDLTTKLVRDKDCLGLLFANDPDLLFKPGENLPDCCGLLFGGHGYPSTRKKVLTCTTTARFRMSARALCIALSRARCVMTTSSAVRWSASASFWVTAAMLTPCFPRALEIWARTPGSSVTLTRR